MTKRFITRLLAVAVCVLASAGVASAQQILNFSVGEFTPRGEDARVKGDVLSANRTFLTFDIKDFNGVAAGAEWLAPVGDFFEVGAGGSVSRRTVPSFYTRFTDRDGKDIEQSLRLRLIPLSATIRWVATGKDAGVQPYVGAGVAVTNWRYSESGDFIDFGTPARTIFRDTFLKAGNAVGPTAVAGLRFNGGSWVAGGEARYTKSEGDLDNTFAGKKIDLGGWFYLFTAGMRFK